MLMRCMRNMAAVLMGSSFVPGRCEETRCILQVWVFLADGDCTNCLETLPFDDPIVVLELDGESLWDVLEAVVSRYPAQDGRVVVP